MDKSNRIFDSILHANDIRCRRIPEKEIGYARMMRMVDSDISPKEFGMEHAYPFPTHRDNLDTINGLTLFLVIRETGNDRSDFELIEELLARGFQPEEIQHWMELSESEYYDILEGY